MRIDRPLSAIDLTDDTEWPWHRTTVSRVRQMDLHALFVTVFHAVTAERSESTRMLAMFAARDPASETLHYYFTPDTARLAPEFLRITRAQPCARPTEAVTFEFGDDRARTLFEPRRR